MKKLVALVMACTFTFALLSGCSSNNEKTPGDKALDFPKKDISTIVPYGAGGTTDLAVRGLIDAIPSGLVSKNFIVSNVTGGSGLIGATQFVNSKADGYTMGVLNCDLVLNNVLGNTEITSDQFIPLACIQADPYALVVSKDAPYKTFEEFVNYAKANPGEITVADTGTGAAPHLAYIALTEELGLDLKTIAYDSAADSVVAVVSGECQASITHTSAAAGQLDSGNVIPLAVTSNERLSTYPEIPAMGELYKELSNMAVMSWIMVATHKDTPAEVVSYLQNAFEKATASDKFKETQKSFYMQPVTMVGDEMLKFVAEQKVYYESLLK